MSCIVGPAELRHAAASSLDADIDSRIAADPDWSPERLRKDLRAQLVKYLAETRGSTHPLVRVRLERDELLRARAARREHLLPFEGPIFDSPFERRRLGLLNSVLLICEAAGAKPALNGRRANRIKVTINHVTLNLLLLLARWPVGAS
jgi:hypothetical protein